MGLIKEFKDFAFKGNVLDMAVGVIIGGAFTSVVSGVVENILTPLVTVITGGLALEEWVQNLPVYGSNIVGSIVTFLLTALCLFLIIKGIRTAEKKAADVAAALSKKEAEAAPAPTTKVCPFCKSEIPVDAVKCAHCTADLNAE